MDGSGEVCLEEKVERLWRSGMNLDEISAHTGLDPGWVAGVISPFADEDNPDAPEEGD